jgi:hypothetical protein
MEQLSTPLAHLNYFCIHAPREVLERFSYPQSYRLKGIKQLTPTSSVFRLKEVVNMLIYGI